MNTKKGTGIGELEKTQCGWLYRDLLLQTNDLKWCTTKHVPTYIMDFASSQNEIQCNQEASSRKGSDGLFGVGDTTFTRNTIYKGNITQNIMTNAGISINEDAP